MPPPVGVLLVNHGGPDSLQSVEPFLRNMFSDPALIPLPRLLRPVLVRRIARRRAAQARQWYALIGGRSPLLEHTTAQAQALQQRLHQRHPQADLRTGVGMRYWEPSLAAGADALLQGGAKELLCLPMYPQFSTTTTGSSQAKLSVALRTSGQGQVPVRWIDRWADDAGYVAALAETVEEGLAALPGPAPEATILCTAHGLPLRVVAAGDPYVEQLHATLAALSQRLRSRGHHHRLRLSYQSRLGGEAWTGPDTGAVLRELGGSGVRQLAIVPLGFVCDHLETLYEIDRLYVPAAEAAGITHVVRVPSLNVRASFIDALAGLVGRRLGLCRDGEG